LTVPRNFDPITLKLFVAVCEERNIARAADREAIVASAVSKRIAAIEAEVGTALLVRGRRGIEPTAAGQTLLRMAREVLSTLSRMQTELGEFATGVQGSVRVVTAPSVLAERLPEDIGSFLGCYQAVRVRLDEQTSQDLLRSVREGSAELGVLWNLADCTGLHARPYRADHLCVAVPAGHALAGREQLRFDETLDHPSVGVVQGGLMDLLMRREAAKRGRELSHRMTVSSMDAACRIVAAGLGVAVLPRESAIVQAQVSGLRLVPLAEPWALRRFVIVSRSESGLSASARLLAEHLSAQSDWGPQVQPATPGPTELE
jgi:DNA-binding transcriptional LysR family regulator